MEWMKNMGLKQSFFLLSIASLLTALLLAIGIYMFCGKISAQYPNGGMVIDWNGTVTKLEEPTPEQKHILELLDGVRLFLLVVLPIGGLGTAGILFYRLKLKVPISVLQMGMERLRAHDLDFSIPEVSCDELGQVCATFETMRAELLKTNKELWRQAEERKKLNAAFSHDLRNPVTVLKGTVKLLRQGITDEHTIDRLESYTLRIEHYVEAMSSIQRLEQMPVQAASVAGTALREELEETARLLAPWAEIMMSVPDIGTVKIDHGIFLTVAENLIGNASRFACEKLWIILTLKEDVLCLTVIDDGSGFPAQLLKSGPKPFGKMEENAEHFGMGLYSSRLLCLKHGGELCLENRENGGAAAAASFKINYKS